MAQAPVWTEKLEPANLVGESFALIGRTAAVMIGIALILFMPLTLAAFLFGVFFADAFAAIESGNFTSRLSLTFIAAALVGGIIYMLVSCLAYAAVTRAALDDAAGRPVTLSTALSSGLRHMLPVTAVVTVTGTVAILAAIALLLPGIYLMALWGLVVPIIVEEGRVFGSLGRSAELTDGYRWPMVGLVLLYILVAIGVGVVSTGPESLLVGFGVAGALVSAVIGGLGDAFTSVFGTVTAVLAFNRLRRIKEGTGPTVADVFA